MPINKAVFQTRALTALIFVLIMLIGLFWNYTSFVLLFSVIAVGCWVEFIKIIEKISRQSLNQQTKLLYLVSGLVLALTGAVDYFSFPSGLAGFETFTNMLPVLWILIPLGCFLSIAFNKKLDTGEKLMFLSGFAYLSIPFALLLNMRLFDIQENHPGFLAGKVVVCGMIFSIWINDTMAYLVGSLVGKTPLTSISPKKTWEGTLGGILLCILTISLAGYWIPAARVISWNHWMTIACIASIFGTFGDLLESKLKRAAEIKDSGNIMPGHGGFLDRFDSLIVATPFVWAYINLAF